MTLEEQKVLYSAVDKLTSTENHVLKEEGDKFKKKIPGLGGKPFTIIIVASWRTGSTFLAQLVASGLKNMRFFIYEPLMAKYRIHQIKEESMEEEAVGDVLENALR